MPGIRTAGSNESSRSLGETLRSKGPQTPQRNRAGGGRWVSPSQAFQCVSRRFVSIFWASSWSASSMELKYSACRERNQVGRRARPHSLCAPNSQKRAHLRQSKKKQHSLLFSPIVIQGRTNCVPGCGSFSPGRLGRKGGRGVLRGDGAGGRVHRFVLDQPLFFAAALRTAGEWVAWGRRSVRLEMIEFE